MYAPPVGHPRAGAGRTHLVYDPARGMLSTAFAVLVAVQMEYVCINRYLRGLHCTRMTVRKRLGVTERKHTHPPSGGKTSGTKETKKFFVNAKKVGRDFLVKSCEIRSI